MRKKKKNIFFGKIDRWDYIMWGIITFAGLLKYGALSYLTRNGFETYFSSAGAIIIKDISGAVFGAAILGYFVVLGMRARR